MRCSSRSASATSSSARRGGAAHAAEGYARSTGKPGVVLVTSGPGATNAVTGITDALMDSIPIVVITGQVPTALIGTDAFQECDTVGITRHCTKHNYLVKDPAKLGDDDPRGVPHRDLRPPRPGRGRPAQGRPGRDRRAIASPARDPAQDLSPAGQGRPRARSRRRSRCSPPPSGRSSTPAAASSIPGPAPAELLRELAAADRRAGHLDADGPRRLPGVVAAMARHARHARHLRGQYGDEPGRPDRLPRRALRRSRDRPARRLLARLEEDPRRHRPLVDQQERARSTCHRRRCRPGARGHGRAVEGARHQPARPRPNGGSGSTAGARASRSPFPQSTQGDHAAARDQAAVGGDAATATRSSPPRSASTRCGRRSISASRSRTGG